MRRYFYVMNVRLLSYLRCVIFIIKFTGHITSRAQRLIRHMNAICRHALPRLFRRQPLAFRRRYIDRRPIRRYVRNGHHARSRSRALYDDIGRFHYTRRHF